MKCRPRKEVADTNMRIESDLKQGRTKGSFFLGHRKFKMLYMAFVLFNRIFNLAINNVTLCPNKLFLY